MHGISFGSTFLPHGIGPAHDFSGHHRISRRHGDDRDVANASPGSILYNLSSSVESLRTQLESLSTSRDLPVDSTGAVSASAMGATVINKQRGKLQIHTQEGDVVTLKFSSKVGVSIEGQQLSDGDTTLTSGSVDMFSRSKIKISVEGELSDEELDAINDLVDKIGDLTSEFFSGDMESVLAQAMSLSYDTSVLADYSLDLSLKQSVSAYTYAVAWAPQQPVETMPAAEAAPGPVEAISAPAEPVIEAASAATQAPVDASEVTPPVETTDTDAAPTTDTGSPTQIVADFVAKVRNSLRMTATETSLGMSYEFKVKLLISSISEIAPAETKPESAALDYLQEQLGTSAAA